jgi:O-antigen ligase
MEIRYILSLLSVFIFFIYFLKNRCTRKSYVLFVLYCSPFIDLTVTSVSLGSFTVFDLVSYFSAFFLIRDFALSKRIIKTYFFLFVLLLLITIAGSIQSEFVRNSLINIAKLIPIFIFANSLIKEYFENPTFVPSLIKGLKFGCIAAVVFLIIQLFIGPKFTFYPYLNQNILDSNVLRYPSYFQDPQMFSQFLAMSSFLFLVKVTDNTKQQNLNYAFFIVIIFVIFLSGGRSGFLGLCVGMLVVFISGKNKFRFFIVSCCAIIYLGIIFFPGYFSMFNRRETYDEALLVRQKIWAEVFTTFAHNPILGIGTGNYGNYVELHSLDGYYVIDGEMVYYGTENGYLKILVETGILGFIVSLSFILIPIIKAVISYVRKVNNYNVFYVIGAIISWMTAFSTLYTLSDKRTLVLLTSLICILIVSSKRIEGINEQ